MSETATLGRRERKKAQTRQALAEAALRLFLERGYDQVTVAAIAAEADTAVTTLFKHFPHGKNALVFDDDSDRAAELTAAVRDRPSGMPVLTALRAFVLRRGVFDAEASPQQRRLLRLVVATPELRSYARETWIRCEQPFIEVLASELGRSRDDVAVRALARYILEIPDLASSEPDPRTAVETVFDHLQHGWS